MNKRLLTGLFAAALIISGCAPDQRSPESIRDNIHEVNVTSNGEIIRCILFENNRQSSIACDWENPR